MLLKKRIFAFQFISMKVFYRLLALLFSLSLWAQGDMKPIVQDTLSPWTRKNIVGFDLNQIAFVNWSAGGVNSISGLVKGNFLRKYEKGYAKWSNELIVRYGLNKQDGIEWRKTDDQLQFNSTFGYRTDSTSNWFYSAKFNFNTQFANGYNYPNKDNPISGAFAPAYTFLGIGAEHANKEYHFNIYISPLTMKNTLVLIQDLANQGAFGVTKASYDEEGNLIRLGRKSRTELGFLFTGHHKHEVYKNIILENRLSLYTDYINKFGNVDIDWQMIADFKVNQYVRANITSQIIYDDDIKRKKTIDGVQYNDGTRIQWKQMLGIGIVYQFQ